jgi:hypothetical protein
LCNIISDEHKNNLGVSEIQNNLGCFTTTAATTTKTTTGRHTNNTGAPSTTNKKIGLGDRRNY